MKRIDILKGLLFVAAVGSSGVANAQRKAVAFGPHPLGTGTTASNFYKDYVGVRFEVLNPPSVAGDKDYNCANDGSGATGAWGAPATSAIVNKPIIMLTGSTADSMCTSTSPTGPFAPGAMSGKVAVVYRGGGIEFGHKAKMCANAGALAVVIVNNVDGGPVGMAAGSEGTGVTTAPVFMISKADGDALDIEYVHGNIANVTITPWGQGNTNDLGFIRYGISGGANYAIPFDQLTDATTSAYMGADGAFIGNFGSADQSSIVLNSTLSFTPTGGSSSTLHTSSVGLTSFARIDSIYAMFDTLASATNVYGITATKSGRFDLKYDLSSAATDDFDGDNHATVSFYASDSVYSKGRYDMTNNKPFINSGTRPAGTPGPEFLWGPFYFVKNGGAAISKIQYTLYSTSTATPPILDAGSNNVYVFKWNDGTVGTAADGIVQDGELNIVALGVKQFNNTTDTSGSLLEVTQVYTDTSDKPNTALYYKLESDSWYYVCVDVPGNYSMGIDGINSGYPRIYSRFFHNTPELEYNNLLVDITGTDRTRLYNDLYAANNAPQPFTQTNFVNSVDSFIYDQTKGIIPQVAMTVNKNPSPIDPHVAVNNVEHANMNASVYPNPAKDNITVDLNLDATSPTVTYTIIDGLARFVSKETTTNVKNEKHVINTSKLPAGNYFLIINANDKVASRKFTIVK